MPIIALENLDEPRLAVFSSMTDAELKDPRQMVGLSLAVEGQADPNRWANGLFVAESRNVIERAVDAGHAPFCLFVEECWLAQSQDLIDRLLTAAPDLPVYVATHEQMQAVTGYQTTRGPLAAFHRPAPLSVRELLADARKVAVLEDVTNYTNIGAIFRSAAALGVDAILVTPACHDPFYRRASRVSMGTVFQIPWTRIGLEHDWARDGVKLLHEHGFKTAALALSDDSLSLRDPRLKECEKLALVLGTEGDGLAESTISACDYVVRIPMAHGVDSLNVAAASAVAFWELCS